MLMPRAASYLFHCGEEHRERERESRGVRKNVLFSLSLLFLHLAVVFSARFSPSHTHTISSPYITSKRPKTKEKRKEKRGKRLSLWFF
jgi:hypothetical protein